MKEQRLTYKQLSYEGFKMLEGSDIELVLTEQFMEYSAWSDNLSTNSETDLPEQKRFENILVIDRLSITTISLCFCNTDKMYEVNVYDMGDALISIKIEDFATAKDLMDKLKQWRYNN
jgi:hypothetical protein